MTDPDSYGYPHAQAGADADPPSAPPARLVRMARTVRDREDQADVDELRELRAAMPPWRLAGSLVTLLDEADAANPGRDKRSDGTIADGRHSTTSDHYPWLRDKSGKHVVRARDLDADGLNLAAAFEAARAKAAAGQLPQLVGGGYLIYNGRITREDFGGWKVYVGPNPHVLLGHVSTSREESRFDDRRPWGIFGPSTPTPTPRPIPAPPHRPIPGSWAGPDLTGTGLRLRGDIGNSGRRVQALQRWLRAGFPLYAKALVDDGDWGPKTAAVLDELARRSGVPEADGRNIGPKLARALMRAGFRG